MPALCDWSAYIRLISNPAFTSAKAPYFLGYKRPRISFHSSRLFNLVSFFFHMQCSIVFSNYVTCTIVPVVLAAGMFLQNKQIRCVVFMGRGSRERYVLLNWERIALMKTFKVKMKRLLCAERGEHLT